MVDIVAELYIPHSSLRHDGDPRFIAETFLYRYFQMAFIMALNPKIAREGLERAVLGT